MKTCFSLLVASTTIRLVQIPFVRSLSKGSVQSKNYDADRTKVVVTWQEIYPNGANFLPDKAIIFFPGWPLRADSKSIRVLSNELANNSGARTYIIHTRSEQVIANPVYQEAQAVCKFLSEKELKHITLVGYSQGGIKALDTIVLLQEMNQDIHVEGLILLVPVGLSKIDSGVLITRYITDFLITSLITFLKEILRRPTVQGILISLLENIGLASKACLDFSLAILKDVRESNIRYLSRFRNELKEMSKRSPYLDRIDLPIVIIQGARDRVSDRERMLTQMRTQAIQAGLQDRTENTSKTHIGAREQILAEDLFHQSPKVKIVKAQKFGTHLLPLFRSKSIARASLYLLRRFQREHLIDSPEC